MALYVSLPAAVRELSKAEVYKVVDRLRSITVFCDMRCSLCEIYLYLSSGLDFMVLRSYFCLRKITKYGEPLELPY